MVFYLPMTILEKKPFCVSGTLLKTTGLGRPDATLDITGFKKKDGEKFVS